MLNSEQREGPPSQVKSTAFLADGSTEALDGYRVGRVTREGERVVISRAVRLSDDVPVLLKTPRNARPTERDLALIAHEVAALTRLAGAPGVVAMAAATVDKRGRPWLVLEDPGGESLNRIAARFRTPARAVELGAKIAGALAEVHRRGVVHRDLKPHHVIILDDGSVRLTDFRCASLLAGRQLQHARQPRVHGS